MVDKVPKKPMASVGALILGLAAMLIAIYFITDVFHLLPARYVRFENAAIVAVAVYFIFRLIRSFLRAYLIRFTDKSSVHPIIFFVSVLGYVILAMAVAATLGINISSVIIGGSLVSVVIGLASQSVLSNQFAGIMITIVRPFRIGDYITLNTWQYGGTFPVLYPKYLSVDRIEASAYSGTVDDITINYTSLVLDSGDMVKIPNGVVVQGAIISRKDSIKVKVRYEVPKYIDFENIAGDITTSISSLEGINGKPEVVLDEATLNTYLLMVTATFRNTDADKDRSMMIKEIMRIVEPKKLP